MNCPYCDTPVDEHEASRETDACVAVIVMGWKIQDGYQEDSEGRGVALSDVFPFFPFLYSADIAAAWKVVEKLRQEFYVDIGMDRFGAQVQLDKYDNGNWLLAVESTRADTFQLAVCRVALKASRKEN